MTSLSIPPYILQELPKITDAINYPLEGTQRIKYTCFDVSKSLITFGATSGGIYIFNRHPCEFVQLIPNKDGAITRLAVSPDEKHIGFINGKGILTVTQCTQSLNGGHSTVVSKEHVGNEVTAMIWSGNNVLFAGDDVGNISVLQIQSFMAKTMFHSVSQTIMSLDSRVCQLDVKECMLLVSTLTRSYICDTFHEQYRQIGQKLRDGEFGACFVFKDNVNNHIDSNISPNISETKTYNIVDAETNFALGKNTSNITIYCARPSSRLWEASIDGTVQKTHQFKQVLLNSSSNIVTLEEYENESVAIDKIVSECEGQSVNFPKIYAMNGAIYTYTKDALYFLNLDNVHYTMWFKTYKDIVDCKMYQDTLYLWLKNGSLINLKYMKIDSFLIRCYADEKYLCCANLCALYSDYLLANNVSPKLNILVGLKDKLPPELCSKISSIIAKLENSKLTDATQMKSGIYVVDNSYHALEDNEIGITKCDETMFTTTTPETLKTFKDLGSTVTDKFSTSKKILKEKWEDFEEKMKQISSEKKPTPELVLPKKIHRDEHIEGPPVEYDAEIIYRASSQDTIEINSLDSGRDKLCKSLYQYFRLSLVGKSDESNLVSIINNNSCDIDEIYKVMLELEQYCLDIGALEESKFVPKSIFLNYLNSTRNKEELLDDIVKNEVFYHFFVDSCVTMNMRMQKMANIACECGYPLPYARYNQTPVYCELIDLFIQKQWETDSREKCYEICKRMPYMWKRLLHLRKTEDLHNVLQLLLQLLDESLLHLYLPKFTFDTWNEAIKLFATLHANMCLNCGRKFENISVRDNLSWDDVGALIIKSVGGTNAIKIMKQHADLIETGDLTMKFYHTCLLTTMYEKYDSTIRNQLTDSIYCSYESDLARNEICKLLKNSLYGCVNNTALPLAVAFNAKSWGIDTSKQTDNLTQESGPGQDKLDIINLPEIRKDCTLCGLPLQNQFLLQDGGLWVFKCGHIFHGACLALNTIKLCPSCQIS